VKKVLVSGGAGFIGSHLIDRLLERRDIDKIVAVDNLWTGRWENLAHISDPRLERVTGDIESFHSKLLFDEALHLASPASPQWYFTDPGATVAANVGGALRIKELLRPGGRFCFTSTSEVYGDPEVSPQPETYRGKVDCTGPRGAYDEAKRCVEALLFNWARVEQLDIRVARIFNAYGERTRSNDGRAISNFISRALSGLPIEVYGDGTQTRSWGYVADIADGLARYFWDPSIVYPGPLNIGSDRELNVLDTARFVHGLVPGSSIEFRPPVPQDPSNRRPDLTLARRILPDWSCSTPYEQGIRATLEWFRAHMEANIRLDFDAPTPRSANNGDTPPAHGRH